METGDRTFSGTELRLEQYLERQDWDFRTNASFWHGVHIITQFNQNELSILKEQMG